MFRLRKLSRAKCAVGMRSSVVEIPTSSGDGGICRDFLAGVVPGGVSGAVSAAAMRRFSSEWWRSSVRAAALQLLGDDWVV